MKSLILSRQGASLDGHFHDDIVLKFIENLIVVSFFEKKKHKVNKRLQI